MTYAIPQKDIQPLTHNLLATYGSLSGVLSTDMSTLCKHEGIKEHSAILLKIIDWICTHDCKAATKHTMKDELSTPPLFTEATLDTLMADKEDKAQAKPITKVIKDTLPHPRTGLFGKAKLQESIDMLPHLPDTESLADIKDFLRKHLHFSGQSTRERSARYITYRMFPGGYADSALLTFARAYASRQELRDVCFYRFCKVEPLMYDVIEDLLLPAIGAGQLPRSALRDYLAHRFPDYSSTKDCAHAVVDALVAARIADVDRLTINFSYRDIKIPSLAFILHSEFPDPGMFDIGKLEQNRAIRAMLWKPDALLPSLYELRNRNFVSKVSEIDSVRQFTTKYTLNQVSELLMKAGTGTPQ